MRRVILKIITVCATKGGVGKTTIAYNFGEWLAAQGNKVLFIDLDQQCNLSHLYDLENVENNVENIFTDKEQPLPIVKINDNPNIDIVPGSPKLNAISSWIATKKQKAPMYIFLWLKKVSEQGKLSKYDYIILDCHNVYDDITINSVVVSDVIFSPITPSEFGYGAKFAFSKTLNASMSEIINFSTGESYIKAHLYFIGNMVKHNTNSSKEFLDALKGEKDVIAYLPEREILNRTTLEYMPISKMLEEDNVKYIKQRKNLRIIEKEFKKMQNIVDEI